MPFQAFPLVDFEQGLYKAKEPWLAPDKTFQQLRNFRLHNGRLLKRKGYTKLAQLGVTISAETIGDGGLTDSGALANLPIRPGAMNDDEADTFHIEATDGTYTAEGYTDAFYTTYAVMCQTVVGTEAAGSKNYSGSLNSMNNPRALMTFVDTGGATQTATVQYVTGSQFSLGGATSQPITGDVDPTGTNLWIPPSGPGSSGGYNVTFASTTTGTVEITFNYVIGVITYATGVFSFSYPGAWSNPVTCDYEQVTTDPIMGLPNFFTLDGNEYQLAATTDKVWRWNGTTENYEEDLGSFTGADSDFLDFCPFENIVIINNGVDAPQKYTPATPAITDMGTDFDADTSDNIEAARFCIKHKNRIIYFRTTESSVDYAQRGRWTPVNDIEYSAATGDEAQYYVDAPTTERIVAGALVGEEILVLFDRGSLWRFANVSVDPFNAYEWQRIDTTIGSSSPRGYVNFGSHLLFRAKDGIKFADGAGVTAADLDIPDEVFSWNAEAAVYSYGIHVASEYEALISFADSGETYPQHALAAHLDANRKLKGYSIYDLPFHCFGTYRSGSVPTWDEAVAGLLADEIDFAPDDLIGSVNFPIVLAGGRDGCVYQYADGYADDGEDVEAIFERARFNPFKPRNCHLGYIDIIASSLTDLTAALYLTADYDASPHHQYTVDFSPSATEEKVLRRININRIAAFHTVKLVVSSSTKFELDGLIAHCKPAGLMRELG